MQSGLAKVINELERRNPLGQYAVEHRQTEGWASSYPKTTYSHGVPRIVTGARIAVVDQKNRTIEAILVDHYASVDGNASATAKPGSPVIKVSMDSGRVTVVQERAYRVNLGGKKTVGITRSERKVLCYIAANEP